MKNTFSITTALATILLLSSSTTVYAEQMIKKYAKYNVVFGGVVDAQTAFGIEKDGAKVFGTKNNKTIVLGNSTSVYLKAFSKTERGMTYGANIGLNSVLSSNVNPNYFSLSKTYVFVEGKELGRIEVGSNDGAGDVMIRGAGSIAAATGGIEGDIFNYFNIGNNVKGSVFVLPKLPFENQVFYQQNTSGPSYIIYGYEKAKKITYLSPKFSGMQVGLSYIPDVSNTGDFKEKAQVEASASGIKNGISGGLMWSGTVKKHHKLEVSLVGEYGKQEADNINNTKAIILGSVWKFKDFRAGGSFGWLNGINFDKAANPAPKDSYFATLGAGMEVDDLYTSLTGMYGSRNNNTTWLVSLGLDYKLAPGFMPYIEASYANLETKNGAASHPYVYGANLGKNGNASLASKVSGSIIILGIKVKF